MTTTTDVGRRHAENRPQRVGLARALCAAMMLAACAGTAAARQDAPSNVASGPSASPTAKVPLLPLMILDDTLRAIPIRRLASVTGEAVTFVDTDGKEQELSRERVLGLVPSDWAESLEQPVSRTERSVQSSLRLVDGVALMGTPMLPEAEPAGESLSWRHLVLRDFTFKLDRIASIDLAARAGEPPSLTAEADAFLDGDAPNADTILLRNGERLRGFVAGFQPGVENGRGAPAVNIEVDKVTTVIPLPRVRAIALSNPRTRPNGITLSMVDGSVISSSTLTFNENKTFGVMLERPGKPELFHLTNDSLSAALLSPRRLMPLASLQPLADPPGSRVTRDVKVIAEPEPLDMRSVQVDGVRDVRWAVPAGAVRFGAMLVLPDDARPLGAFTCMVEVLNERAEPLPGLTKEASLSSKVSSADVSLELPPQARSIRIRRVQGASGPVQVSVLLRRGAFVLAP